jgi:NADH:ubiquinone oxidoreductase subunit 6 (subunit J)
MAMLAFLVLALTAVASGVAVFTVDSMARATFALALSFVAVGGELILLDLAYLGVITVLMMVMEMAIMVVFMVMFMMNPAGLMPMSMLHNKRGALVISAGTFLVLAAGAVTVPWPTRRGAEPADPTRALGEALMGPKMLVMMAVSAVLFATMVSAVVLAVARGRYERHGPPDGDTGPAPRDRLDTAHRDGPTA